MNTYMEVNGDYVGQQRIRGSGFFDDPNDLAQLLLVAIPFAGHFYGRSLARRISSLGVMGLLAYGCFLTHSRGGLLGAASLVLAWMMMRGRVLLGFILSGITGIGMLALGFVAGRSIDMQSGYDRMIAWGEGFQMLKSYPLFGVGMNGFLERNGLTAHNSFILCMAEQGLVGYFLWLGALCVTFMLAYRFLKLYRDEEEAQELCAWLRTLQIALFGWLVTAWFLSRTYSPLLFLLLGMMAAVLMQATAWANRRGSPGVDLLSVRVASWVPMTVGMIVVSIAVAYSMLRMRAFI